MPSPNRQESISSNLSVPTGEKCVTFDRDALDVTSSSSSAEDLASDAESGDATASESESGSSAADDGSNTADGDDGDSDDDGDDSDSDSDSDFDSDLSHPEFEYNFEYITRTRKPQTLTKRELKQLMKFLLSPCDLLPAPSEKEVEESEFGFLFGFYVSEEDIRRYAGLIRAQNPPPSPDSSDDEDVVTGSVYKPGFEENVGCLIHRLSEAMVFTSKRVVRYRRVIVTQSHKDNATLGNIIEDVGAQAGIVGVLNTRDYERGYKPSTREMEEISWLLDKRMPAWWPAAMSWNCIIW